MGVAESDTDHRLCACGSGLRAVRCCEMEPSTLPHSDADQRLVSLVEGAVELHRLGKSPTAEKVCLEVLELAPHHLEALSLLYRIRRANGHERSARSLLRRIVTLHPAAFWAVNELILVLLREGDVAEAEIHARRALQNAAENPQSHNLMGMVMTQGNRPRSGEYHYRQVLAISRTRDPIVLANLAWNLQMQGRVTESRTLYEEAIAARPEEVQTLLNWARLEEADCNFDRASELLGRAERLAPNNRVILLVRVVVLRRLGSYEKALDLLDAIDTQNRGLDANELLEKGRLLEKVERWDEAFTAFAEGKRLYRERGGLTYLDDRAIQLIDRLRCFFSATRLRALPQVQSREDVPQPIFILGFPRSGTTLVEQMLSAHRQISAGDELPFIDDIVESIPRTLKSRLAYPEALTALWSGNGPAGLQELRDNYLHDVHQLGILEPGSRWFTDKMPLNETHLGLIALMFPCAPLIHILRHPLDVVLSVFANYLMHGFHCGFALDTAAQHYRRIIELVDHYRSVLPLHYMRLRYEDIIDKPEASVRRTLDFIGAPFDPSCLKPHKNRRYARTASYAQVKEPIHDGSRYRYRYYLKQMEPVIPILEPVIDRLGYSIDSCTR